MSQSTEQPGSNELYGFLQKQLDLLGDQDPLSVLAQTPDALAQVASRHPIDVLRRQAVEGKWTVNEILAHLADMEWVFGFRMRTILCDKEPSLMGIDQDLWVQVQTSNDRDPSELVASFAALRKVNLALWQRTGPSDLERIGHHSEAGMAFSLGLLPRVQAGHDLNHLQQMQRYLKIIRDGEAALPRI